MAGKFIKDVELNPIRGSLIFGPLITPQSQGFGIGGLFVFYPLRGKRAFVLNQDNLGNGEIFHRGVSVSQLFQVVRYHAKHVQSAGSIRSLFRDSELRGDYIPFKRTYRVGDPG
jgi:hypothetical protein